MASSQPAGPAVIKFRPELTGDLAGALAVPDLHEIDGDNRTRPRAGSQQQHPAQVAVAAKSVAGLLQPTQA